MSMKPLLVAALALIASSCASRGAPRRIPHALVYERVSDLHAAQDWQQLSAYAAVALRDFNFELTGSQRDHVALWQMFEACERTGDVSTHALVLRNLAGLADPDAPLALLDFARAHGREPLERCGALERRDISTWLAMGEDCERGEWLRARERIAAAFPDQDGEPHAHAVTSHILLGDLLRRAERCEPALVEYSTAAFWRSAATGPLLPFSQRDRTLGCVRLESLLFEMSEGEWALQAMRHVNFERAQLDLYPRSKALDQAVRDGANAEAEMMQSLLFEYDLPAEPDKYDFESELAGLFEFQITEVEGSTTTYSAAAYGITLTTTDEVLRVECSDPRVGAYEVAWTSRTWEPGPKCYVFTEPISSGGKCVRSFRDGSLFFGSSGFASEGLFLRQGEAPYTGPGLFGRPLDEAVQLVRLRKNEPAAGPTIEGLGERRSFIADVACGGVLIGEGYVREDELVPDGVVRLSYASDQWFRTRFALGVASPWRRSGTVIHRSNLSMLEDLSGTQVAWLDPEQWLAQLEQAKQMYAAAQREEAERAWRMQMEGWSKSGEGYYHGVELQPEVGVYTCYRCDGVGAIYSGGGWESYTYYVQSDPGSPPSVHTGSRWVSSERVACPECFGSGRKVSR